MNKLVKEIQSRLNSQRLPGQCYPNVPDNLVISLLEKYLELKEENKELKELNRTTINEVGTKHHFQRYER